MTAEIVVALDVAVLAREAAQRFVQAAAAEQYRILAPTSRLGRAQGLLATLACGIIAYGQERRQFG